MKIQTCWKELCGMKYFIVISMLSQICHNFKTLYEKFLESNGYFACFTSMWSFPITKFRSVRFLISFGDCHCNIVKLGKTSSMRTTSLSTSLVGLTSASRRLENLCFFIETLCWAPRPHRFRALGLSQFFLYKSFCLKLILEQWPDTMTGQRNICFWLVEMVKKVNQWHPVNSKLLFVCSSRC